MTKENIKNGIAEKTQEGNNENKNNDKNTDKEEWIRRLSWYFTLRAVKENPERKDSKIVLVSGLDGFLHSDTPWFRLGSIQGKKLASEVVEGLKPFTEKPKVSVAESSEEKTQNENPEEVTQDQDQDQNEKEWPISFDIIYERNLEQDESVFGSVPYYDILVQKKEGAEVYNMVVRAINRFGRDIQNAYLSQQSDFKMRIWWGTDSKVANKVRYGIESILKGHKDNSVINGGDFFKVTCQAEEEEKEKCIFIYLERNKK